MITYDLIPLDATGTLDLTALNAAAAEGWRVVAILKRPDAFEQVALVERKVAPAKAPATAKKGTK